MIDKDDFVYTMELGDYKYIFEYDNIEELKEQLAITKATHQEIINEESKYNQVNRVIKVEQEKQEHNDEEVVLDYTFAKLELEFISAMKKADKVSKSSYKAYASTFNKLKKHFRSNNIDSLYIDDYEEFRDMMLEEQKLVASTINTHMIYLNMFLEFARTRKKIKENNSEGIISLKETVKEKELFSSEDIKNIFEYDYEELYKNIFKILAHSGMRISELYNLNQDDIKKTEDGFYYFDITQSKTSAGIRQIPIHKSILSIVLDTKFPISSKTNNAFQKEILKQLYKVVEKESTKSTHTFRANFINQAQNKNHRDMILIQEIVGHSKNTKEKDDKKKNDMSLTADRYGKGFNLELKQKIVDSIEY